MDDVFVMNYPQESLGAFWLILSAVLVLITQLGFLCLETGVTRAKNAINVAMKNAADFILAVLLFWLVGFGLMYGGYGNGFLGFGEFALNFQQAPATQAAFFFFQAMFCCTAVTIISGAVAERITFRGYLLVAALVATVLFPSVGHWVWAGNVTATGGWLQQLGFVDFAGAVVVHCTGGGVALAAALVIGPRLNRFIDQDIKRIYPNNLALTYMGLLFFILGWFGFAGGSALAFGERVPGILINTLVAGVAGAAAAYIVTQLKFLPSQDSVLTPLNGCLAGLVAISASCHAVATGAAFVIGAVAALVMIFVDHLLLLRRVDDAVGAVAVHLGAGVWGALALALFADLPTLATGLSRFEQLGVQAMGVIAVVLWSLGLGFGLIKLINFFWPLRVSAEAEMEGLNVAEHGTSNELQELLQVMDQHCQASDLGARVPVVPFSEIGQIAERYNRVMNAIEGAVKQTQAIVRDIHDGVVTFNSQGILTSLNPAAEAIFGVNSVATVGRPVTTLFDTERKIRDGKTGKLFGLMELNRTVETLGFRRGTGPFTMEVTVTEGEANGQQQFTALFRDVQGKRLIEDQLFKEQERALVTLGSIADGVITTDEQGQVVYLNAAAERLTGWDLPQACNLPFADVFRTLDHQGQSQQQLHKVLAGATLDDDFSQTTLINRNGSEHAISFTLAPIKDKFGQVFGAVVVFHDMTSTRALQRQLSYQATHDNLTGVLNRSGFEVAAQKLINRSADSDEQHVLGFIDLDQFKNVNDACGHQAGDELLRQIAQLIKRQLRGDDTLARLGGDEFTFLLHNCDEENGLRIAEIIRDAISAYRFSWVGNQFTIGASIGLVRITRDTPNLAKLMGLADAACYAAKDEGRNRVNLYRPNELEMAERRGQVQWVAKIRQALDDDALRLFCQPIEALQPDDQHPKHIEVFVRMLGENGKLVPPGAFIPAAERYSLIQEVDLWVVRNTLAWLGDHERIDNSESLICSINLSGTTVSDKSCLNEILAIIDREHVAPSSICFEITETAAIGNFEAAKRFILALKAKGCHFSLDDFGSGLSSFGYLKNLPVDYLKIDGVFIRDILNNRVDRVMVHSISQLAQELGLKTIAEFVGSKEIANELQQLGVDYAQGYFVSEPMPLEAIKSVSFMPR